MRREGIGLRRYVHIGTGNYNSKTARSYTDLGLLSCREELGADVTDLFNSLTGPLAPAGVPAPARRADDAALAVPRADRARGGERPRRHARPGSSSRSTRSSTRR